MLLLLLLLLLPPPPPSSGLLIWWSSLFLFLSRARIQHALFVTVQLCAVVVIRESREAALLDAPPYRILRCIPHPLHLFSRLEFSTARGVSAPKWAALEICRRDLPEDVTFDIMRITVVAE